MERPTGGNTTQRVIRIGIGSAGEADVDGNTAAARKGDVDYPGDDAGDQEGDRRTIEGQSGVVSVRVPLSEVMNSSEGADDTSWWDEVYVFFQTATVLV